MCGWLAPEAYATPSTEDASAATVDSIEVQVLFPLGKSSIDLSFQQNGAKLADFIERIQSANANTAITLTHIYIKGYSSPDGSYQFNLRLARERAENLASYLKTKIEIPDSLMTIEGVCIDWEGLYRAVGESSLRNAHQVQYIIRHEPEFTYQGNVLVRSRKQQLQDLDDGLTWSWMMENLYPALRSSASVVCYIEAVRVIDDHASEIVVDEKQVEELAVSTDTISVAEQADAAASAIDDVAPLTPSHTQIELPKYPIFALRSNLLLPLLNVGVEVPVSNRWSLGADYYYPWVWPAKSNENCFELIFMSAEARYWFNRNRSLPESIAGHNTLLGHSVAVYGAWGYYDIEHNWKGHQGHAWSTGFDYMFAVPIAKGRLHLEFEIAVGAIWSPGAQPYHVYDYGGHLVKETDHTKNYSYFGPTKVGISLVLPINRKVKQPTPVLP